MFLWNNFARVIFLNETEYGNKKALHMHKKQEVHGIKSFEKRQM
jgi:hypothetical protein